MICNFCEKHIPDDSNYCQYCGSKLIINIRHSKISDKKTTFSDIRKLPSTKYIRLWRIPGSILYYNFDYRVIMFHMGSKLYPVIDANDIVDYEFYNHDGVNILKVDTKIKGCRHIESRVVDDSTAKEVEAIFLELL